MRKMESDLSFLAKLNMGLYLITLANNCDNLCDVYVYARCPKKAKSRVKTEWSNLHV